MQKKIIILLVCIVMTFPCPLVIQIAPIAQIVDKIHLVPVAQASLQSSLDSMFMSNVTPPQAYNSQSRGGFVGGGISVRAPISNINLVAFDPPRISAGCGGIDMYGGSFTFINGAQLAALFRQIAANAAGALFKMAIDSISPEIGKIMQDFQSMVQSLNNMLKNTCQIGSAAAKVIGNAASDTFGIQNDTKTVLAGWGKVADSWAADFALFTTPQSSAAQAASTGAMPFYGNLVWKALAESGAGLILGSPDTSFSQTPTPAGGSVDPVTAASNEVVMSLLGTQITTQTVAAGGAPVAPAIINNVEQTQSGGFYPHSINLWDLKDKRPSGSELLVWRCQGDFLDTGCQNPVLTKDTTWQGTEGYVNRIMFGQVDDTAGISSGSLLDNLSNCTTAGCSFTAEQTRFIATISAPLLKLLRDVQRDPSAMQIVAQMLAPVMSLELLERYGIAAENAARNAFTGVKNTTMPTHIPARMRELSEQLTSIRLERMKELNKLTNTKEYANLILQNDPSLFARISRGR